MPVDSANLPIFFSHHIIALYGIVSGVQKRSHFMKYSNRTITWIITVQINSTHNFAKGAMQQPIQVHDFTTCEITVSVN